MKLSDFNYTYPKELIAQQPLAKRDESRMMVINRRTQNFRHAMISDLPDLLATSDSLILNDSKVIPARLFGKRGNGKPIELLVVEPYPASSGTWRCLLKKAARIRAGEKFFFGMQATATAKGMDGHFLLAEFKGGALELAMKYHGAPPLPPYIRRDGIGAYTKEDRERYQTIYAKKPGSAAAPTAGLHLSEALLEKITAKEIGIEYVTLHVGIDTFAPLRVENLKDHRMHGERFKTSEDTANTITKAKISGRKIIACGTTTTRALESAWNGNSIRAGSFQTELFITPGFKFNVVDCLLTNFHQPKSTLLVLVSAFAGREFILDCYKEAIASKYRLFSYGDCMLIE